MRETIKGIFGVLVFFYILGTVGAYECDRITGTEFFTKLIITLFVILLVNVIKKVTAIVTANNNRRGEQMKAQQAKCSPTVYHSQAKKSSFCYLTGKGEI